MRKLSPILTVLICCSALAMSDFQKEEEAWRTKRLERLTAETGWLTLVGLQWLKNGVNEIALPNAKTPGIGAYHVNERGVRIKVTKTGAVTFKGVDVTEKLLVSDEKGEPDIFSIAGIQMTLIKRGERYAIRMKNPKSETRLNFKGIEMFPFQKEFRIEAKFIPYEKPIERRIPTMVGTEDVMMAPGLVTFLMHGKEISLEPVIENPGDKELFYIFKDATSGNGTYPAGRFMYSEMPRGGKVTIDFNHAYNPPCAFTPYATCPLPLKQNILDIAIEAGEKTYGHQKM